MSRGIKPRILNGAIAVGISALLALIGTAADLHPNTTFIAAELIGMVAYLRLSRGDSGGSN